MNSSRDAAKVNKVIKKKSLLNFRAAKNNYVSSKGGPSGSGN